MKRNYKISSLLGIILVSTLSAQPWQQNDTIFNTSGVPSLTFSQPRFADLDGDGDQDMIMGSSSEAPFYAENIGTVTSPAFTEGDDIFAGISALDAEMGVCADLDNDGDLDFITSGFTGLNYFENIGTTTAPSFLEITGFFTGLNAGQIPVPDLADVDADDDLDMVVGFSENGAVIIYLNIGTVTAAQFSESSVIEIGDVGLYAYPNFCDPDADGDQDIVVGRDNYGFVYYQNNGTPQSGLWEVNTAVFTGLGDETYWNSPDLVDLNGNGTLDLIFGQAAGPLYYYVNTGTPEVPSWQQNTTLFGGIIDVGGASNPVFYDFDGDGDLDLISGSQLGNIKYYQNVGTSYAPAWLEDSSYFASIDHSIYSAVTIGDVNGDGLPDAIVGDLNGHFFYHQNTGTGFFWDMETLASVNLGGWSAPRLVDMDEDGDLDIVAGNEAGNLFYFENQGSPSIPFWVEIGEFFNGIDIGSNCVPTIGDLNLDNSPDLITGDLWSEIQFFENIGGIWQENPEYVSGITGAQNTAPALVDLDNDGDLDLALGNYNGTFNYYENLHFIVDNDPELPQAPDFKLSNYPNPFNPSTTIAFEISNKQNEPVELEIYNLKGQKVKVLECSNSVAAYARDSRSTQSVVWNGTDESNHPVASGIYFYKLKAGVSSQTKKMILMK
ncbi:MAG: FG-GAP-like repeat-containing protein [Candidatus Cloacimonadales bacterium]|nr:FG-GAP-like repeat-containing protein [Candidatus Cloacimonadales bacterium]